MRLSTVKKHIQFLLDVKNSGKTLYDYCKNQCWKENNGIGYSYKGFVVEINNLRKQNDIENKEVETLLKLYSEVTSKERRKELKTTIEVVDTDDRAETSILRGEDGKINFYEYQIYRRDKTPLVGKLTREEMNTIYRLYSYYGDSLTQRVVARHFVDLSLIDFKRILRAFNITKASAPFAPHYFEEYSENELRDIQLREKENSFLRKAEEDQIKNTEKLLKKYAQENIQLKRKLEKLEGFSISLDRNLKPIEVEYPEETMNQKINIYLADMHLGADVTSGTLSKENINYGFDEAKRRLSEVIKRLSVFGNFEQLNVVLLGDNVDCCGVINKTARLDHYIPENMDEREQANAYIELINWFIGSLISNGFAKNYALYSVPCGNHSGAFEYVCNKAIMHLISIQYPDVSTTLFDEFYGLFELNGEIFCCCHGKDDKYMRVGLPKVLTDNAQVRLYEFFEERDIHNKKIHVIKGDLHSDSLTACKRFDYRNVLSLYGSSDYSVMNFSATGYGVSYDMFIDNQLVRGVFENI